MAEVLANATISPSAVTTGGDVTVGSLSAFTVASAALLPSGGTFRVLFVGAATDGSDDSIAVVTRSGTTLTPASWEVTGAQATFPAGSEIEVDHTAGALTAYVSDQVTPKATDSLVVHLAGAETLTGAKTGPNGSASAATWAARAAGNGVYSSAANVLDLASAGTRAVGITSSEVQVQSTRNLRVFGGITLNRVTGTTTKPQYTDLTAGDPLINTGSGIDAVVTTWDVDDALLFDNSAAPKLLFCESEIMVQTAPPSGNTLPNVERGQCGTSAAAHADGVAITDYDPFNAYGNVLIPTNSFRVALSLTPITSDIYIWTPPRAAIGAWSAPADTSTYEITVADCNGYVVHLMEPNTGGQLAQFSRGAGEGIGFEIAFDSSAGKYNVRSSYGEI